MTDRTIFSTDEQKLKQIMRKWLSKKGLSYTYFFEKELLFYHKPLLHFPPLNLYFRIDLLLLSASLCFTFIFSSSYTIVFLNRIHFHLFLQEKSSFVVLPNDTLLYYNPYTWAFSNLYLGFHTASVVFPFLIPNKSKSKIL